MKVRELAVAGLVLVACVPLASAQESSAPGEASPPESPTQPPPAESPTQPITDEAIILADELPSAPPPSVPNGAIAPALAAELTEPEPVPPEARDMRTSFALLLGYGFTFAESNSANIYGLGFGVRGGYDVAGVLYVGGIFNYWVGETFDVTSSDPGNEGEPEQWSVNQMQLGLEAAYDIALIEEFSLRPMFGVGLGFTATDMGITRTSTNAYLSPGVTGMYNIAHDIFVSLDVCMPILFANDTTLGLTLQGTAGMRF